MSELPVFGRVVLTWKFLYKTLYFLQKGIGKKFRIFQFFSLVSPREILKKVSSWRTLAIFLAKRQGFVIRNSPLIIKWPWKFPTSLIFWTSSQNGHRNFQRRSYLHKYSKWPWKFPTSDLRCIQNSSGNCQSRFFNIIYHGHFQPYVFR